MLQFWKKGTLTSGKVRRDNYSEGSRSNSTESSSSGPPPPIVNGGHNLDSTDPSSNYGPLRGYCDEEIYGDLESDHTLCSLKMYCIAKLDSDKTTTYCVIGAAPEHRQNYSKLSKSLNEVVADKGALGYFIQYMEARQKVGYIKFWLDCESFCSAAKCSKLDHINTETVSWAVTEDMLEKPTTSDICSIDVLSKVEENCDNNQKEEKEEETNVLKQDLISSRAEKLCKDALMDALQIYRKYLSKNNATKEQLVDIPEDIRKDIISKICKCDGSIDPDCFLNAQKYIYDVMDKEYFNDFLRSDYHCKHQIDILTSGNVSLCDILYNENALFHFTEFMEQEGNQSILEFWLAASNFQQQLLEKGGVYDPIEAQNDAIVLYDKYFSLQATCPLGFSDKVRFEVEQNICREEGPLPDCFEKSSNIASNYLQKNYFQPFLSSQLYLKYLSELINTIQSSHSLLGRRRSESSSNQSLSSVTTAHSTEDNGFAPRKVIHNVDEREMSIDSKQLYDPDSLWKRRHQSGLSFGRINELGRFETDFEPEPDKRGESRLSRVMKKFVNIEEDKAKEEMAWKIAAMIVKDVTSVTLGENNTEKKEDDKSNNS